MTTTQRTLEVPGAVLTYDVRGALPPADGRPPVLLVGQPMDASGFATLAGLLPGRTVVTYDPRGLGRSTRSDGSTTHDPVQQAEDLHALVGALGAGPVDLFGSSGGAVTSLALVAAHPDDVRTLVAHEPPSLPLLPDAEHAQAVWERVLAAYRTGGWGAGMAAFVAMTSTPGLFTADSLAELPDPAAFGMPAHDDGSRDDPLLSGASSPVTGYVPDVAALRSAPVRVVVAAGIESKDLMTWRTSAALADALGVDLIVFPSHHGGFMGPEHGMAGEPEAFAARLQEVLDAA